MYLLLFSMLKSRKLQNHNFWMHRENENCVNKGAPPIESPLFNLINKRGIDHQ
jgi:hypothetical protein